MTGMGLEEVTNPSLLFLSEHANSSGSVVTATIEGTRAILTEIQALVTPSNFGMPRRNFIGVDYQRVNLLVAVLEKRGRLNLQGADIFIKCRWWIENYRACSGFSSCVSNRVFFQRYPFT